MPDKAYNKVIYGNQTLIDLTSDTATPDKVLKTYTFHKADGTIGTGSCEYDVDSSSATAAVAEVLATKTFAKNGSILTGTMPNRGGVTGTISTKAGTYSIQQGYHDGSGSVAIDSTEQAKIIATNIRQGVTILGVEGSMSGTEDVNAQSKSVTPSASQQTVLPDSPTYNYLSQVTVAAIPYVETENAAGGLTVTIG